VTVAEVARAAGVSSVTVFKHFPKKEDLFLDRSDEAAELLRGAVRDAGTTGGVTSSLRNLLVGLADERHSFSGLDPRSVSWFRTVAQSPTLLARARYVAAELQHVLELELGNSPEFTGDPGLSAALFIAGYARILAQTARYLISGTPDDELARQHVEQVDLLLNALQHGVLTATR